MGTKEITNIKNSKLQKLYLDLSEYSYEITHIQGKDNVICDALSRSPIPGLVSEEDIIEDTKHKVMVNSIFICQANVEEALKCDTIKDLNLQEIKDEIKNDSNYKKIIEATIMDKIQQF